MKKKNIFLNQKITALMLAFAVSMTSVTVNVPTPTQAARSSFTLTKNVTIGDGETYQLSAKGNTKGISFQSSNKKIVTVSKSGKIKGQKSGKATVIAKVNKKSKKCTVTVKKAPKAIKIKNGNLELYTKNMEQLSVSFTNGYSNKITFRSANKEVATVSSQGLVTAVGEGKTTITAKTFNGKKAKISCVVREVPQETASSTPAYIEEPFPTIDATASAPVFPAETASVTEIPSSTPIAVTPDVPTETPVQIATEAPTETPVQIATEAPTETPVQIATEAPTEKPVDVSPTETVTSTPVPTFDTPATSTPVPTQQATVIPDNTPTVIPVIDSTISPTATTAVPEPVTASAIVSKIENGVVYIDKDHIELQLSEKNYFYKNNYKITKEEIFVGDRITITYYGAASDPLPSVLQDCKIEVTDSRSRLLSPKTIGYIDEAQLVLYEHVSPFTYVSKTKVFKNGKEIPFSELKEGDTVRVNYTYHGSDYGMVGFYETLDTIVVLEDENVYKATKETGVITNIEFGSDDANYYVEFVNGASGIVFVAACTNDTIIKKKDEKTEYVTEKSSLQIGQTISVSYVDQSYDMLPVWLDRCKIVIDTTVPIATPTVEPPVTSSPIPTATPDGFVTCSAVVSKIEDGTIYVDDNTRKIELTSCVRFYKNNCMITKNEIFAGDTITIKFDGYTPNGNILVNCEEIEVTQSQHGMVSQGTIREIIGGYIYLYYQNAGPLSYDPLQTKIYKDGEEISFQELKEGDTLRVNYTHCYSNGKDDTDGFYEVLDTVVVLDEDITNTRKASGVITKISTGESVGEDYFYVTFQDGNYCAMLEDTTIVKMKEDGKEFAVDKTRLGVGQTIEVFFEEQSYDLVPTWLSGCKKIVIDTTVPIVTPTMGSSNSPVPTDAPPIRPTVAPAKPVIYLYPEKETSVSVDLDFHGSFTYTYPYTKDGHWDVVAKPDGTLTNKADGKEYSYLFWEGVTSEFTPDFSKGFCIKGEDTTAFLQKVLPEMGLTPKEYNEFIVYWAPLLQNNPYNLISFQAENYEEMAPLHVNPAPGSMLRVYMAYKPLTKPVAIPEQTFAPFERKGFTVVEWGGCMVNE